MTNYVQPTMADIEALVADFKRTPDRRSLDPNKELWLDWVIHDTYGPKLAVRWYTSVTEAQGVARDCGKDAMRVVIVKSPGSKHERILYSMIRVHRTPNWQTRIRTRLKTAYTLLAKGPRCPACDARMAPRAAKSKDEKKVLRLFWSCTRYPHCQGTRKGCKENDPTVLLKEIENAKLH